MTERTRIAVAVTLVIFFLLGFLSGWTAASMTSEPASLIEVSAGYDGQLLTGRVEVVTARLERASRARAARAVHEGQVHAHASFGAHLTAEAVRQRDEHREQIAAAEESRKAAAETLRRSASPRPYNPPTGDVWMALARCESGYGGPPRWNLNTGNGYYGGLQFSLASWEWVGGTGYPHEASPAEQIARAQELVRRQGFARAFPGCSRKLGLR